MHGLDALLGEEVLLPVFDFGGIFQRGVHVAITMRVRDPLHGLGRGLSECDRRAHSLNEKELVLLACLFALFLSFAQLLFFVLPFLALLLDLLLNAPKTEAGDRRGYARGDQCCENLVHVVTS